MAKMDDITLNAILDAEISEAVSYVYGDGSKIAADRAKALDYYNNEPLGNEREGRSQVQTSDVQDTIESILPALLKIFYSGDEIVKYAPKQPNDEEAAKQATDLINYIFTNDNKGFLILYTWFKDALLQKNGFVFPYWKEEERTITTSYTGLDEDALALLLQDEDVELVSVEVNDAPEPMEQMPMQAPQMGMPA